MAIVLNQGKESIVGKVLRFTFNRPGIPDKYFEVERPDRSKCFCKGKIISGKDIHVGETIKLFGEWRVNNNPKYVGMGLQFYFKSYELLSPKVSEAGTKAMLKLGFPSLNNLPPALEEVTGHIVSFRPFTSDYRIFLLHAIDGREFWCQGTILREKPLYEDQRVRLSGNWQVNPYRPEYGLQFYFSGYDVVTPGQPEKVIRRSGAAILRKHRDTSTSELTVRITNYLKKVGSKEVDYPFHSPRHTTISLHVRTQLKERILRSNRSEKDFFFLTALLDRRVEDKLIQSFRQEHRSFKKDLIWCWKEAEGPLERATGDIQQALADADILMAVAERSPTYRFLQAAIPGDHAVNQLLACLKIIRDRYDLMGKISISDFVKTIHGERVFKEYLQGIYGIGPKIAPWSLTNVTGHWFVIDIHINSLIKTDLPDTLPEGMSVSAENAEAIFEGWFGSLDEKKKEYPKLSHDQFTSVFTGFSPEAYERLPFIVTQYLWFYGKYYGDPRASE